jgi:hypothetical protein
MKVGTYKGYPIYVSDKKLKKYYAMVGNRKVYFGDSRYEQYYDKMGHYSHLNHNNKERRKRYKQRHEKDRHNKGSAGWFADQILW